MHNAADKNGAAFTLVATTSALPAVPPFFNYFISSSYSFLLDSSHFYLRPLTELGTQQAMYSLSGMAFIRLTNPQFQEIHIFLYPFSN